MKHIFEIAQGNLLSPYFVGLIIEINDKKGKLIKKWTFNGKHLNTGLYEYYEISIL